MFVRKPTVPATPVAKAVADVKRKVSSSLPSRDVAPKPKMAES